MDVERIFVHPVFALRQVVVSYFIPIITSIGPNVLDAFLLPQKASPNGHQHQTGSH